MHGDYLHNVVSKLTCEDVEVLGILSERNAASLFKSVSNQTVYESSKLTEARYRRTINRLMALDFIQVAPGGKERLVFLSHYGGMAFELFIAQHQESEVI